jgi:hypothetical protein
MPYADSTVLFQAADTIGHDSIGGPIASSDHVASSGTGDPDRVVLEERATVSLNSQLGGRLAEQRVLGSAQDFHLVHIHQGGDVAKQLSLGRQKQP